LTGVSNSTGFVPPVTGAALEDVEGFRRVCFADEERPEQGDVRGMMEPFMTGAGN